MSYSPKAQQQKDTELSELRRKFLADRDAENELLVAFHNSTQSAADYAATTRIHQHSRKNLSSTPTRKGNGGAVRLRRKPSKRDIKKKHNSPAQRRHSLSTFILRDQSDDDCREENLSMRVAGQHQASETTINDHNNESNTNNKTARQQRFRYQTRANSVVLLGGGVRGPTSSSTKPIGLRRQRRASVVEVGTRSKTQPKWFSNMSSKLGLDW